MTLPAGLHRDVPHDVYHADPCAEPSLSSHMAGILLGKSPLHAKLAHPRFGGDINGGTRRTEDGAIRHKLVFGAGPEIVEVCAGDWRTKDARQKRDDAIDAGAIPVLTGKLEDAKAEAEIIRDGFPVPLDECLCEVTIVWFDRELRIWCRMRADAYHEQTATIYDLKNCENVILSASGTACIRFGYDIQAAAYIEGVESAFPGLAGRVRFMFHFVEPGIPPVTAPLSGEFLELGRRKWKRAKELWAQCLHTNVWPGPQIERIECPPWAMAQDMENQLKQIEGGSNGIGF